MHVAIAVVLFTILAIYFIVNAALAGSYKFLLSVIVLLIAGKLLSRALKLQTEYGIILLKTKKGIEFIRKIARVKEVWIFIADTGLVVAYGLSSAVMMRNHIDLKKLIIGMGLLIIISLFVGGLAAPFLIANLKGQVLSEAAEKYSGDNNLFIISTVILILFGWFGTIVYGLISYSLVILGKLIALILGTGTLTAASAGATLIIPGITIPLFEGIIALIVILVVHEGAHAVLSVIGGVPLKSSGLALFGIIPIGAFIEPDEGILRKKEVKKQTRVLIAGPAVNLITAILFFLLFIGFTSIASESREYGISVTGGLNQSGVIIYTLNGINATSNFTLEANSTVLLSTNKGEMQIETNELGKIPIRGFYTDTIFSAKFSEWWMNSIYLILGFTFALNFVLGVCNLLPIPMFDGYRIIELNIENKLIVKGLMYLATIGLLLNFLPLLF